MTIRLMTEAESSLMTEVLGLRAENAQLRREVNDLAGAQADAQEFWAENQELRAKVRQLEGES
tara:strand:+ start:311 stop:499 length:189 start_codon:yes stop_codon:yes gene_type:complete